MAPFDIGLDGKEIEASPGFDNLPAEPPRQRFAGKINNEQRKGLLDKKNSRFIPE